jgi:hypothetical protein
MAAKQWVKNEPVPIPAEKPRLLRKLAEALYGPNVDARDVAEPLSFPVHLMKSIMAAYASATEIRSGRLRKTENAQKRGKLIAMPTPKKRVLYSENDDGHRERVL